MPVSSHAFERHLERVSPFARHILFDLCRPSDRSVCCLAWTLLPYNIFGLKCPFFHQRFSSGVLGIFPFSQEVSYSGFGYPLYDFASYLYPWGPLSAPNVLGLHSTELFSSLMIEIIFRIFLFALGLPQKTFQPPAGTPAIFTHQKSRAPDCYPKD